MDELSCVIASAAPSPSCWAYHPRTARWENKQKGETGCIKQGCSWDSLPFTGFRLFGPLLLVSMLIAFLLFPFTLPEKERSCTIHKAAHGRFEPSLGLAGKVVLEQARQKQSILGMQAGNTTITLGMLVSFGEWVGWIPCTLRTPRGRQRSLS